MSFSIAWSSKKRRRSSDADGHSGPSPRRSLAHKKDTSISNLMDVMDIDGSQSQSQSQDTGSTAATLIVRARPRRLKRSNSKLLKKSGDTIPKAAKEVDVGVEEDTDKEAEEVHGRQKRHRKDPPPEPVSLPASILPPKTATPQPISTSVEPEKKQKKKKAPKVAAMDVDMADESGDSVAVATNGANEPALTPMQAAMKARLQGGAFRLYNELMYKTESKELFQKVKEDPKIFAEYHVGFRHQVTSWPTNPVDHYISLLSSFPKASVIADLGCGDATLAKRLIPRGFNVLSFDLVSDGEFVVEADICDRIPLPGSERGGGRIVDVVICALSLMSVNWPQCLREARRILRDSGELKIAEVTSRFTNVKDFVALVSSLGFKLVSQEAPNTHFTLFEFRVAPPPESAPSQKDWTAVLKKGKTILKPCEYKRR